MPTRGVFLVTGLPASGKSTFAVALARALGAPLLMKDAVKEALLDTLGATDPAASRRLSDASFAALFALADVQLDAMGSVVLEGNFRPGEHEPALQSLLSRHAPLPCTQVLVRAAEALRQSRLLARATDTARHPGHRDVSWVTQSDLRCDAFLALPGSQHLHDGAMTDLSGCALIHSLAKPHLV